MTQLTLRRLSHSVAMLLVCGDPPPFKTDNTSSQRPLITLLQPLSLKHLCMIFKPSRCYLQGQGVTVSPVAMRLKVTWSPVWCSVSKLKFMLVTILVYWCPSLMLKESGCCPKWPKLQKPSSISQSCHQHISSPSCVNNIDVAVLTSSPHEISR